MLRPAIRSPRISGQFSAYIRTVVRKLWVLYIIGPRKIKFIPIYFCAMYLENIMLPLVLLVPLPFLVPLVPLIPLVPLLFLVP